MSLQEWKKVQALVGKTGKEGLKRRCLEYDPQNLANNMDIAKKSKDKMAAFELDDVRDVSAGAATFYLWVRALASLPTVETMLKGCRLLLNELI